MSSSPTDQMIKLLGMLGSDFDGEVLNAARKAHALLVSNDWTWEQLLANGSAMSLTEEQLQKVYGAGLQKGEAIGYQRAMADAEAMGGMTPKAAASRSTEIGDDLVWLERILEAAEKAEAAGHLTDWELKFAADKRNSVARFGRAAYVSPRQRDSLNRLEQSLRRRGYM
jgi:hypothetical protein